MSGGWSVVAAMFGLLLLAAMLVSPWATRLIGQPAPPNVPQGKHQAAPPALLELPAPRPEGGAHRPENTPAEGEASTVLVTREGPRKLYPGKPIEFTASR